MTTPTGRRYLAVVVAWTLALTAALLWPLVRSGYPLGHDLVFTPRQPLDLASIGLSGASPRAVPLDALVALAERVVDGAVVGRLALVAPLLAAGVGVAVLLGSRRAAAGLAASGAAVWNPYVAERLALGQWALLWAYAALPWIVLAVRGFGRRSWSWAALAAALAAAAITPTGALIGAAVAIVVTAAVHPGHRTVVAVVGLAVAVQLPWAVPSLVGSAALTSDPTGVAAFATRSEFGGGTVLSVLTGGGVWDADVVPASRSGLLAWLAVVLVVGAALAGWARLVTRLGRPVVLALAALAGAGLVLALLPTLPGGLQLSRALVGSVPGAGLLRDAQKWVLPLVVLTALLVGAAVERAVDRIRAAHLRVLAVVVVLTVPVLLLPDAASPVRATVEPVHYPGAWRAVVAAARGGDAVVLPFASYRTFPWAPGRSSVLDPAPRLLAVPAVVQDRLAVGGRLLRGESPRAAAVGRALAGRQLAAGLAAEGIRWVVVEGRTPGAVPDLAALRPVITSADVSLYRVPGRVRSVHEPASRVVAVVLADVLAVLALVLSAGSGAVAARRRARPDRLLE